MREQHLHALTVAARLFEGLGLAKRAGNIASILMHVTRDLTGRCLRAAPGLKRACITIALDSNVTKRVVGANGAGCCQ